uniref:Secreted protein n=1 Tax=Parascaris univalens TaxID=6257 RepID=A0A915C855_PARUN
MAYSGRGHTTMRYMLFVALVTLCAVASGLELKTIFEFIFTHPKECGDPFANDAEWIPAHRFCTAKCDVGTHICMKHVKSEKQKCERLPAACVKGLKGLSSK